jgi:hypothetical protein
MDAPSSAKHDASRAEVKEAAESIRLEPTPLLSHNETSNVPSLHSQPPFYQIRWTWLLALATITSFILTVLYAFGNTGILNLPSIRLSISFTVLVLRVLSEVTGLFMVSLIDACLERLQWMLAARDTGFPLPGFLALGSGTGKLGMLNLLLRGFRGGRRWSLIRLILAFGVPVLGVVILSRVNAGLVFNEYASFPVAGGVGDFDGSNVEQWKDIAALQITTDFKNFLQNPQLAVSVPPLLRDGRSCLDSGIFAGLEACGASFFIHGGLQLVTPPAVRDYSHPDAYVYLVQNMQGVQLDFAPLPNDAGFDGTTDCIVAGNGDAAVQFCASNFNGTSIKAKYVHCPSQISFNSSCLTNTSWQSSPGWNTSMTAHRRTADVYFARYNFSTVTIRNLSPANPVDIPPSSLLHVFNITFSGNALGFSTNTPGQQFIYYLSTYLNVAGTSSFGYFEAGNYLRNLLALPLYYFQPTYLSNASLALTESNVLEPNPAVPRDLHTRAAFADPSYQVLVAKWSVLVYAIGAAITIALCLIVLVLGSLPRTAAKAPDTTMWPVVDFVTNCEVMEDGERGESRDQTTGLRERLVRLKGVGLRKEADEMGRIRVFAKG